MPRNRLFCTLAVLAIVGVSACKKDAGNEDTGQVTDTVVTADTVTQEIQTTVPDSQEVITDVDTTKDTVDINR